MSINRLFKGVDKEWIKIFTNEFMINPLASAIKAIHNLENLVPEYDNIFNFARLTKYNNIKVVIVGQDPYPQKDHANGLAFSSNSSKIPLSLKNIYKCLLGTKCIHKIPETSDLSSWAEQGVLLLNTSLTTLEGKSNVHSKIWAEFTDNLIHHISHNNPNTIFLLWGRFAQTKKKLIKDSIVLEWIHPSPLAQRVSEEKKFINCDHFVRVNQYLTNFNILQIDWGSMVKKQHIIYTDGACSHNKADNPLSVSGYAFYIKEGPLEGDIVYGKVPPKIIGDKVIYGTNNRGEGMAILLGLKHIYEKDNNPNIILYTDSKLWMNMILKYMPKWEKDGKDFKEQKNSDIAIPINNIVKKINNLQVKWIRAHKGNRGNEIADEYAVRGKKLNHFEPVYTKLLSS